LPEWKPIDTAPTDDTVVLVFDKFEGVCCGRRGGQRKNDSIYYVPHPSSYESELLDAVTHWMPLPEPPNA
jgi:hypothetical protein